RRPSPSSGSSPATTSPCSSSVWPTAAPTPDISAADYVNGYSLGRTASRCGAMAVALGSGRADGGGSAVSLDIQRATGHDRTLVVPLVLAVVLVVVGLVLRAIVAPLLLVGTVVLSFGAALGISALVFNYVFHFAGADPSFPLWTFVFLVALGTDYNIFLMIRVHEGPGFMAPGGSGDRPGRHRRGGHRLRPAAGRGLRRPRP